jgi:4-cresol dehydrogenase (hydroxylating)
VPPLGVVFPVDTHEVQQLMLIAREEKLVLYPISRGKNYGYGEAQGTDAGQLIVDFSRMNTILHVDETLGYATLQPGVSQRELAEYLKVKSSRLQADVTGAGLDASVVGNVLERGFGHTDYGDRYARVIRMTAVLPDGTTVQTGFGDVPHAKAKDTYRYGVGPALEGLFSQSNFAIITELTLELMPQPEKTCMFVLSVKEEAAIGPLVETIRELRLQGVINSAVHFANKARAIGSSENRLAGAWNLSGSLSGPRTLVSARKRELRRALRRNGIRASLWFFDDFLMGLVAFINQRILPISLYQPLKDAWDLQKGIPTDHPLRILLEDDKVESATLDPGKYETGFLWVNAVCAAEQHEVKRMLDLLGEAFADAGYEFRVTFTAVNPRSLIMITNITFKKDESEMKRAGDFSRELYGKLIAHGFLPYRSGSGAYGKLPAWTDEKRSVLNRLKAVFDPSGILAPGKYNID